VPQGWSVSRSIKMLYLVSQGCKRRARFKSASGVIGSRVKLHALFKGASGVLGSRL
jgi:hypothetical protein